jgi:hypothetical protein
MLFLLKDELRRIKEKEISMYYPSIWDSSVGIAMGYGLNCRGLDSRYGEEHFSLLYSVQIGSVTHPASYPMGTEGFLRG